MKCFFLCPAFSPPRDFFLCFSSICPAFSPPRDFFLYLFSICPIFSPPRDFFLYFLSICPADSSMQDFFLLFSFICPIYCLPQNFSHHKSPIYPGSFFRKIYAKYSPMSRSLSFNNKCTKKSSNDLSSLLLPIIIYTSLSILPDVKRESVLEYVPLFV